MTSDMPEKLNEKIKSLFWECAKHKSELHKSFEVLLERDVQIASLESQLKEKDQEIERLKDAIKSRNIIQEEDALLISDIREALREAVDRLDRSSKTLSMAQKEIGKTLEKCRKLIGD